MDIYFDYNKIPRTRGTAVTLGNFDGFHLGHQKIVSQTLAIAHNADLSALVVTFHPHPRQLFSGDLAVITPLEKKIAYLEATGIDQLLVQPFTREFSSTDPHDFVLEYLIAGLNCRHVIVGYDYRFGAAGAGDTRLMSQLSSAAGIGCDIVPPLTLQDEIVSSTAVRQNLARGQVEKAAKFMGRLFSLSGRVEEGTGRGGNIGFPTANIYPHRAAALPAWGAYLVGILLDGEKHWGVANIGCQLTDNPVSLEIHILEYQGNLYGKTLDVCFFAKLRDEMPFPDDASLQAQVQQAIALLSAGNVLKLQRI